jgi:hypothetical protein
MATLKVIGGIGFKFNFMYEYGSFPMVSDHGSEVLNKLPGGRWEYTRKELDEYLRKAEQSAHFFKKVVKDGLVFNALLEECV